MSIHMRNIFAWFVHGHDKGVSAMSYLCHFYMFIKHLQGKAEKFVFRV